MKGLDLRLGCRRSRRRVWGLAAAVLAILLSLAPLRAVAVTLPAKADTALASLFVPHYMAKLDALTAENTALHRQIAALQPLQRENEALHSLLGGKPLAKNSVPLTAVRLAALHGDHFEISCTAAAAGDAVLDSRGRFAGCVVNFSGRVATVDAAGCGSAARPCIAGGVYGVLYRKGGRLYLGGLPRHSGLAGGEVTATLDGDWVGRIAAAPVAEPGGLTETVPLCETAEPGRGIYFIATEKA